ncbi:MAG: globin domain-containing protein [Pseudomonadota bacterium]
MSLSTLEISAVRDSFASLAWDAEGAARSFYGHLFDLAPETRGLFRQDIAEQGRKLMAALGFLVQRLETLERVVPVVEALGRRHVEYGVQARDYASVGQALDRMLAERLPAAEAPQARMAWAKVYGALAEIMITAAYADAAAS